MPTLNEIIFRQVPTCQYDFSYFPHSGKIHFEARIEPVGDPSMRVDWFINGRPLPASSRATTTFKFGFISLDLLSIVLHDSGEYTVRVTNNSGSAESTALLSVQGEKSECIFYTVDKLTT